MSSPESPTSSMHRHPKQKAQQQMPVADSWFRFLAQMVFQLNILRDLDTKITKLSDPAFGDMPNIQTQIKELTKNRQREKDEYLKLYHKAMTREFPGALNQLLADPTVKQMILELVSDVPSVSASTRPTSNPVEVAKMQDEIKLLCEENRALKDEMESIRKDVRIQFDYIISLQKSNARGDGEGNSHS